MPQERGGAPLRFFSKPRARAYNVHERDFARACAHRPSCTRSDIRSLRRGGGNNEKVLLSIKDCVLSYCRPHLHCFKHSNSSIVTAQQLTLTSCASCGTGGDAERGWLRSRLHVCGSFSKRTFICAVEPFSYTQTHISAAQTDAFLNG